MTRLLDHLAAWIAGFIARQLEPDPDDDPCEHHYVCTWCGQGAGPGE